MCICYSTPVFIYYLLICLFLKIGFFFFYVAKAVIELLSLCLYLWVLDLQWSPVNWLIYVFILLILVFFEASGLLSSDTLVW